MKSLLDIAAAPATAKLTAGEVAVPGISVAGLAMLFTRFPVLRDVLLGSSLELDAAKILAGGPEFIAAVIAAGLGSPGAQEHEIAALTLALNDQLTLIETILRVTFPDGPKNFQARLVDLLALAGLSSTSSPPESPSSSNVVTAIPPATRRAG